MNILIVSYESWKDTNNGGNVLSNIFSAFPDAKLAQIYCCGEQPQNSLCQNYYQISDSMLLKKTKGCHLEVRDYGMNDVDQSDEVIENTIKNKIPGIFKELSLLLREVLWDVFNWKTSELQDFIRKFKPDVIFAPCYSYYHVSKLALYVKSIAKCPMISYISDDNYSLKKFSLSLCFFINRLKTRKWIRKLFSECSLVYTMTEMQQKEYETLMSCPMKVLCKSAEFVERKKEVSVPVQMIYAGGLYLNRWKVLRRLSEELSAINEAEIKAQLHIYSGSQLSSRKERKLNDNKTSFLHKQISYNALIKKYSEADVAIHVESFDIKNRLLTRLSFSTKIIDCLSSGCAVLAIGPSTQAGIGYLKKNDAAICVDDIDKLGETVSQMLNHTDLIEKYSVKAYNLGMKNHQKTDIEELLNKDFCDVVAGNLLQ